MMSYIKIMFSIAKYKALYLAVIYLPNCMLFPIRYINLDRVDSDNETDSDSDMSDNESNQIKKIEKEEEKQTERREDICKINKIIRQEQLIIPNHNSFRVVYACLISTRYAKTIVTNKINILLFLNDNSLRFHHINLIKRESDYKLVLIYNNNNENKKYK